MSMTQIAFLRKADIPTNRQIQEAIQKLGYAFTIAGDLERKIEQGSLECSINGHKVYVETYSDIPNNAITDHEAGWMKADLTDQDTAISFVWGADFAAGACIGLISIALTDLSNALVYYMDDQMKYTREMLIGDMPQFLAELDKQSNNKKTVDPRHTTTKNSFWNRLKKIFK